MSDSIAVGGPGEMPPYRHGVGPEHSSGSVLNGNGRRRTYSNDITRQKWLAPRTDSRLDDDVGCRQRDSKKPGSRGSSSVLVELAGFNSPGSPVSTAETHLCMASFEVHL